MRDATASWSGYLYQSVIGLVVGLEYLIIYKELQENYSNLLISFEELEDFSICEINRTDFKVLEAHQVKNYKDPFPSKYMNALRHFRLGAISKESSHVSFYLHTNVNPDISNIQEVGWKGGINHQGVRYTYKNGNKLIGSNIVLTYMRELIREFYDKFHDGSSNEIVDISLDALISRTDELILHTKHLRDNGIDKAQGDLSFNEIEFILTKNIGSIFTAECVFKRIKTQLLENILIFKEESNTGSNNIDRFLEYCISSNNVELKLLIKKLCPHLTLDDDLTYYGAMGTGIDILEGLLAFFAAVGGNADFDELIFSGTGGTYRPSPLRVNLQVIGERTRLNNVHIPTIIKNINDTDIKDLFRINNISIVGETIENIWDAEITKPEDYAARDKITEPELKRLVNVVDAIGECNDDD